MTATVSDLIARQTRLFEAASTWRRSRGDLAHALTSPAYTGGEVAAIRQRHDAAVDHLVEVVDAIADENLPAAANGTSGSARRVTQLEGEIALQAIAWFHARDTNDLSILGLERAADEAGKLHALTRELVDELAKLGAPS